VSSHEILLAARILLYAPDDSISVGEICNGPYKMKGVGYGRWIEIRIVMMERGE
jgi:hypothetical protein